MISASEQVTRLRALLDRIQQRASEPRPARFVAPIVVEEVEDDREPTLPGHAAAATAVEAPIEPAIAAPVELPAIEEPFAEPQPAVEPADVAEARSEAATLEEPPIEPALATYETPSVSEGTPSNETPSVSEGTPVLPDAVRIEVASFEATPPPEPILTEAEEPAERVEAVSGEFAVAEVPMELEELGPADDLQEDEHVVEIQVEEPVEALSPVVEEGRPIEDLVAENAPVTEQREPEHEEERISEPPASGRELVVTLHESQRIAVAAPATPDQHALELTEEPEAPPESSRNLRAAPAVPATSDVIELQVAAPTRIEVEPVPVVPEPPIEEVRVEQPAPVALESEPAPAPSIEPARVHLEESAVAEPQQVAVAVSLDHRARPVEQVVVGVDADVIHAELTPADVAAFIGAARSPRPETFGVLLDAALDL